MKIPGFDQKTNEIHLTIRTRITAMEVVMPVIKKALPQPSSLLSAANVAKHGI